MKDPNKEEKKLQVEEDEKHLLIDHHYDGIQELNHPLPSWWSFGFYAGIVYAIGYFIFYQLMGAPTLREEFNKDYAKVLVAQEEARKLNGVFRPEKYAAIANKDGIKKGEEVFINNCFPCHAENGRGDIGPNLTDKNWLIAKSTPESIYNVAFSGSEANGMPPWGDILTPEEIYLAAAYISSLKNTFQKDGKAPQGKLIED